MHVDVVKVLWIKGITVFQSRERFGRVVWGGISMAFGDVRGMGRGMGPVP